MAGRELLLVSGLKSDGSRLRFHSSGYGAADKLATNSAVSSGLVRDGQGSAVQIPSIAIVCNLLKARAEAFGLHLYPESRKDRETHVWRVASYTL